MWKHKHHKHNPDYKTRLYQSELLSHGIRISIAKQTIYNYRTDYGYDSRYARKISRSWKDQTKNRYQWEDDNK